jgi:hypothetical protein
MNCDDLRNIIFSYAFMEIPKMPKYCECSVEFNNKWRNECECYCADEEDLPKLYLIKDYDGDYQYYCNTCRVNTMMDAVNYPKYRLDWVYGISILDLLLNIIQKEKPNCSEKQVKAYIKRNERLFYDDMGLFYKGFYQKKTKKAQILFKKILLTEYKKILNKQN